MRAEITTDSYRHLLAVIAANGLSQDRLIEVAELSILSAAEGLFAKQGREISELTSDLVDIYTMLIDWRVRANRLYPSAPKLTLITTEGVPNGQ